MIFITQRSLTRMFDVVKKINKNKIDRQFIYNRVPVKLNEHTKQINQNRFLKTNWEKKSEGKIIRNKWNNLHKKLKKVEAQQKFKFELEKYSIEIHEKISFDRSISSFRDYFYI